MEPVTERTEHEPGVERVRRLRRTGAGTIGGVASGLAHYFGADPVLFQLGFVALSLFSGAGVAFYLAGWLLLPTDDDDDPRPIAVTDNPPVLIAGLVLASVGLALVLNGVAWGPEVAIPAAMVLVGAWLLNQRAESNRPASSAPRPEADHSDRLQATPGPTPPDSEPPSPPPAGGAADSPRPPDPAPPPPVAPSPPPARPAPGIPLAAGWEKRSVPGRHWAQPVVEAQAGPVVPPGPPITSVTLAAIAVVIGALLVARNVGGVEVGATLVLASVVTVLGAGLIASSLYGRALVLIPLAVLGLALLAVAPLVDSTVAGGIGTRRIAVIEVDDDGVVNHELGMGELLIDLRELDLSADRELSVTVGAGYTRVVVPTGATVDVEATNEAGYLDILGSVDEGIFNHVELVTDGSGRARPEGSLRLVIDVTFGYAEVVRRG
jgi:phage shock protein PspC (stress-responsive transcriptional regulator)/predicted membrane protein